MKPNVYKLIERCVEDGINYGYQKAFKHTDEPSPDHIKEAILDAIMLEISEWFDIDESSS